MSDYILPQFDTSFVNVIEEACAKYADRECLKFKDETYSYRDVDEMSIKIANKLIESGFEKGMHAAVYSLNSAIAFIAALGIIRAGGAWIPVNARNAEKSNKEILRNLGCDALFYQQAYAEAVSESKNEGLCGKAFVCLDENAVDQVTLLSWMANASTKKPEVSIEGKDLISIPQTGGTTGLPKGVMISHRNFCSINYIMCNDIFKPDGTMLCAAPMTHVGGRIVLTTMQIGFRYVILEKVDPQIVLQTIQDEKVTDLFLPPTAIYAVLDQPDFDDFDLSSLRILGYGSSPMSVDRLKEALERIGPVMSGGFGQTECPMSISSLPPQDHFIDGKVAEHRLRSVGRAPSNTTLAILDDEYNELPTGERGEIAVKGGAVSEGYYKAPEQTAKIRRNGWHLTGDIGYLDEEGFLYIVDRKKDLIITGGFNVYPAEVEQVLMGLPGVKLAAVIGLPDEKWGEAVSAFLEVDSNVVSNEQEIIDTCKEKLGGVKAPKNVRFINELPRTPIGKLDKKQLRKEYWEATGRQV